MQQAAQQAKNAILYYPHAKLTTPTAAVTADQFGTPLLRSSIVKLSETAGLMNLLSFCGPKLHFPYRVLLLQNPRTRLFQSYFNPRVVHADSAQYGMWENCISLDAVFAWIRRPRGVTIEAADENGMTRRADLCGLSARLFLHELDHLDGKCIISKVPSRDFLVTSNALMQKHTWGKDFPSPEAFVTPLFAFYDCETGEIAPVPELAAEAAEMDRLLPRERKLEK